MPGVSMPRNPARMTIRWQVFVVVRCSRPVMTGVGLARTSTGAPPSRPQQHSSSATMGAMQSDLNARGASADSGMLVASSARRAAAAGGGAAAAAQPSGDAQPQQQQQHGGGQRPAPTASVPGANAMQADADDNDRDATERSRVEDMR